MLFFCSRSQDSSQSARNQQWAPEQRSIPPVPPPHHSKFRRHYIQQMHLLMANQHSGHRTIAQSCLRKLSTTSQPPLDMMAERIQPAGWFQTSPNSDHGLNFSHTMTLSTTTAVSFSIATPLSVKKLFCFNKGSCTKSCTQVMTPSTSSQLRATRSKLMLKGTPRLLARFLSSD